ELDRAVLQRLEAGRRPQDVAELHVFGRRQRLQHRPLRGQLVQHPLAARDHLAELPDPVVAQVVHRRGQLVDQQLQPQLAGLVLDDEQHLVVVRRVRQRLLRGQQPVQPQVAAVAQAAVQVGVDAVLELAFVRKRIAICAHSRILARGRAGQPGAGPQPLVPQGFAAARNKRFIGGTYHSQPMQQQPDTRMSLAASFEIEYLQYLKPDGSLSGDLPPAVPDPAALLPLFKRMLFVRTFDSKAIALQRTGKLGTYAACLGHEATHVGIGASMRPEDVFAPSYREYGAQFMRGVKPRDVLLYWGGDERGNDFEGPRNDYPWCVPISTQCLMASGAALSFKLRRQDRVAVATCGDGGSSKTDFYAAVNSAGAYSLPLVLCVINNGWAISVRRKAQPGAQTVAQKGRPGGLHGRKEDGNDRVAGLEGRRRATEGGRSGEGGRVIECITYRLHDHTTAADARRYRGEEEVK